MEVIMTTIEHPFFDDYANAFQASCLRDLDIEGRERLKKVVCVLWPAKILEMKWEAWQIGIPRPVKLSTRKAVNFWEEQARVLLRDFFKRVANAHLYCDYSAIAEKYGTGLEKRIGKTGGMLFNLEAAYWTFNVKFNKWMGQNRELYNCCLVCPLDEMLARFDVQLRAAFFPTPGPYRIRWPFSRKRLQNRMLRIYAPALKEALMKEIWK